MSTISNGRIKIQNGSPIICGVYEATLASFLGPFPIGSTVSGSFGFRGHVASYDGGIGSLHFTATGTAQPVLNELITTSGAASGTIGSFDNEPDFSSAHVGDWLYVLPDGGTTHYLVGAIPTKSQLLLTTAYAGTANPEEEYAIGRSRTPVYGFEYPERGDKGAGEIVKRMAFDIEELLASGTGIPTWTVENSLTISGMAVATANSVAEIAASGIVFGSDIEELRKDSLSFFLSTVSGGQQVTLLEYAPYSFSITSLVCKLRAGQVNTTLSVNGVGIAGITSVTASDSQTPFTPSSGIVVSAGQRVSLKINAIASADEFAGTVIARRTF